jgi:hypothetical protein
MEGLELFDTFRATAWRLETRQTYVVPEEEGLLRAWRSGEPLAGRPDFEDWLGYIQGVRASGRRFGRVHVVELPLSEYMRFEFSGYALSLAAGEDIRIAVRDTDPRLDVMCSDFWLFDADLDAPTVLWLKYEEDGRLLGSSVSRARADVDFCIRERDVALELSIPLSDFLVRALASP